MMAHVSGDTIVVDGVVVAALVDHRSNEREELIEALRGGIDLEGADAVADLRKEVERAKDDAREARAKVDDLKDGIDDALSLILGYDVNGAIRFLRSLN